MQSHRTLILTLILAGSVLLMASCNAPGSAPDVEEQPQMVEPSPTATEEQTEAPVERVLLEPCSLVSESEAASIVGGPVQMQPTMGTGGCTYRLVSDDPALMAQLVVSAAQGEEAKALTLLSIGFLAGFSGDPGIMAEFEALNNRLPGLSLSEVVNRLGELFQGTGVSATVADGPDESALWLLYEDASYAQGTMLLVRGDEYVSLSQVSSGVEMRPDALQSQARLVFERLPPAYYVLDEDGDGSFTFEYSSETERAETVGPADSGPPDALVGGLVWVTAPNAGQVHAIDPLTNQLVATIEAGRFPSDIAVAGGRIWVVSDTEGTLWRIDPESRTVVETISLDGNTTNVAAGPDAVWVAGGLGVRKIDLNTGTRHGVVYNRCFDVVIGEGTVWVSQTQDRQLLQIDPTSRRVVATVKLDGQPTWLAYGHDLLWVVLQDVKQVAVVDPIMNQVVHTLDFEYVIHGMAVGPERVWYTHPTRLYGVEPGTWDEATIVPSTVSFRITYFAGSLWTTGGEEGVVARYDLETGETSAVIEIGTDVIGIAAGE